MNARDKMRWNVVAVIFFLFAAYVSVTFFDSIVFYILGITFLIAFLYGVVSLYKIHQFIF